MNTSRRAVITFPAGHAKAMAAIIDLMALGDVHVVIDPIMIDEVVSTRGRRRPVKVIDIDRDAEMDEALAASGEHSIDEVPIAAPAPQEAPEWLTAITGITTFPTVPTAASKAPTRSRESKQYKVVDPTIQLNGVPEQVKCFLLAQGTATARTVEERLRLKQKSVQSALHLLRVRGVVVSEDIVDASAAV